MAPRPTPAAVDPHGRIAALTPVPARSDRSYDDKQVDAVLKTCVRCQRELYFTDPTAERCGGCQP